MEIYPLKTLEIYYQVPRISGQGILIPSENHFTTAMVWNSILTSVVFPQTFFVMKLSQDL